MNETIINFLKFLDINIEEFDSMRESQVRSGADVNWIVRANTFFKPHQMDMKPVSIADVVGYNYSGMYFDRNNLINALPEFFDKDGDGYHSRSASMLEIPSSQIMKKLNNSFTGQPIHVTEVDKGIYNIGNNGMHRFHVLKIHYLKELSKLNPQDKLARKKLREKYTFPAMVSEVDFVKTYSAFLLKSINSDIHIEKYYEDWKLLDRVCLFDPSNNNERFILSNDQLIDFVNKQMKEFLKSAPRREVKSFNEKIKSAYDRFDSFKNYYDSNFKQFDKEGSVWKSFE